MALATEMSMGTAVVPVSMFIPVGFLRCSYQRQKNSIFKHKSQAQILKNFCIIFLEEILKSPTSKTSKSDHHTID